MIAPNLEASAHGAGPEARFRIGWLAEAVEPTALSSAKYSPTSIPRPRLLPLGWVLRPIRWRISIKPASSPHSIV